jgi:hypothetical protein
MAKRIIYRRSDDGTITTQRYAEQNPKETEREVVYVPNKNKSK